MASVKGGKGGMLLSLLSPSAEGEDKGASTGPSPLDADAETDESLMAQDIMNALREKDADRLADSLRAFINMG